MSYEIVAIKGSKPTKKDPKALKIPAKEVLEKYLNTLPNSIRVISVLTMGFGGYQVVIRKED